MDFPVKDLDQSRLTMTARRLQEEARHLSRSPTLADRESLRLLETHDRLASARKSGRAKAALTKKISLSGNASSITPNAAVSEARSALERCSVDSCITKSSITDRSHVKADSDKRYAEQTTASEAKSIPRVTVTPNKLLQSGRPTAIPSPQALVDRQALRERFAKLQRTITEVRESIDSIFVKNEQRLIEDHAHHLLGGNASPRPRQPPKSASATGLMPDAYATSRVVERQAQHTHIAGVLDTSSRPGDLARVSKPLQDARMLAVVVGQLSPAAGAGSSSSAASLIPTGVGIFEEVDNEETSDGEWIMV